MTDGYFPKMVIHRHSFSIIVVIYIKNQKKDLYFREYLKSKVVIKKNYEVMQKFNLENIPSLKTCILGALEFLESKKLPKINIPKSKKIIVIGSENALVVGKIIFEKYDAIFANESNYQTKLKNAKFDLAIIISASGKKHAPIMAKKIKSKKIKLILFTTNKNAPAKEFVDETLIFPKQREPYTYNTSTYLSMILAYTKESPKKINEVIKKIKLKKDFSKYNSIYIIIPEEFQEIKKMFLTKFEELFGPKLNAEIYTYEQTKHAKTVIPSKKQLFISIGIENKLFGEKENRLHIPLPINSNYATIFSTGYYLIGKIQEQKPPYFQKNILNYTKQAPKLFGHEINPIVEDE